MGHVLLKNWYLYGPTFKFLGGTSLPKPNLSTPPSFGQVKYHSLYVSMSTVCLTQFGQKGGLGKFWKNTLQFYDPEMLG